MSSYPDVIRQAYLLMSCLLCCLFHPKFRDVPLALSLSCRGSAERIPWANYSFNYFPSYASYMASTLQTDRRTNRRQLIYTVSILNRPYHERLKLSELYSYWKDDVWEVTQLRCIRLLLPARKHRLQTSSSLWHSLTNTRGHSLRLHISSSKLRVRQKFFSQRNQTGTDFRSPSWMLRPSTCSRIVSTHSGKIWTLKASAPPSYKFKVGLQVLRGVTCTSSPRGL